MTTVLVVDDDRALLRLLDAELTRAGHRVVQAASGEEAQARAQAHHPAVVLLDVALPDIDGFTLLTWLKRMPAAPRVLMLTGRAADDDRVLGLSLGADDYVGKPFSVRELVLRVELLAASMRTTTGPRRAGRLEIDVEGFRVCVDGVDIAVTPTELRLLQALSAAPGRLFGCEELTVRIWGRPQPHASRMLKSHVQRLRRKLGAAAGQLETVHGLGYRLRDE